MQKQLILVCQHLHEVDRLFRCRKLLAMAEFEREIYLDPNQDLDLLWHNLNLKYLGINYPPDMNACYWATNRFASSLSCNVHNYVLADVFAVQLQHSIQTRVLRDKAVTIVNNKDIGKYLVDNLFRYGNLLPWEELIEKATGEPLNSTYFVDELVGDEADMGR
jgi:peptidyl-dipeptidase A